MIGGLAKLLLLRVLPRRLIPLLTAWEIFRVVRALQRPKQPELEATTRELEATTREREATTREREATTREREATTREREATTRGRGARRLPPR